MRKVATAILLAVLAACNDGRMLTGPDVQSTHQLGAATEFVGTVAQVEGGQFVLYPQAGAGYLWLQGHEDELERLVGAQEAHVLGVLDNRGVVHVQECHCPNSGW